VSWVRSGVVSNVPGCSGITYRLVHTNRADSGVWESQLGCFLYGCASLQQGTRRSRDHQNRDSSPGSLGAVLKDQNVALGVLCQYIVHCLVALGMSLIDTRQVVNVLNVRFSGSP
jgi:hypothetical protein